MRSHSLALRVTWVTLAMFCIASCAKKESAPKPEPVPVVEIAAVDLGHRVNAAELVDQPADTFAPNDTIWASVRTNDTPAGTKILARWVYTEGGAEEIVTETEHTTAQAGAGATSFFLANTIPWPAGAYELRVLTNGKVQGTKGFNVRG